MANLKNALRAATPPPLRRFARATERLAWRARCDALDARDAVLGATDPLTPPRRMWELVTARNQSFEDSSRAIFEQMLSYGVQPHHAVLDVGCGIGRAAVPLTGYLDSSGSYDGIDIMPEAISWCSDAISPRFPNFRFHLANVRSDRYRQDGATSASTYVFPLADSSIDFVLLISVFTHMLPADLRNYLSEIARVMRTGAVCAISYYLLDHDHRAYIAQGGGVFSFKHAGDGYWAEFPHLPEAALAYERAVILDLYKTMGLEVFASSLGVWSRTPLQGQDVLVARKVAP